MAFVINVIKWLLWTVESGIYYSDCETLVNTPSKHDADPMLAHRLQRSPSIKTSTDSTPHVCWELRSAALVLLNTAGDDYKPAPIQCLLNVGPAYLQVPACLFFTFFFFQIAYIYTFTVHTIYSTEQKKTRQYVRGLAKLKQFQTSKKKLDRAHNTHPPPYPIFFFFGNQFPTWTENLVHVVAGDK